MTDSEKIKFGEIMCDVFKYMLKQGEEDVDGFESYEYIKEDLGDVISEEGYNFIIEKLKEK